MKGVRDDEYPFYDEYFGTREVLVAGSSNSGKTSLINALNDRVEAGRTSKRSAKTQALQFYLCQKSHDVKKNKAWRGFLVDSPGYGFTYAPVRIKNQWKKLMAGYLSHGVRISLVLVLVNADTGLRSADKTFLEQLAYY